MNTKAKRITAGALSLTMMMSLAACGSNSSSTSTTTDTSSDGTSAVETSSGGTYTYNYATSSPSTWSPTDWQNEVESNIQSYTCSYFYDFVINDAGDGYDIVPNAAADYPQDTTADLTADQKELYGLPEDATEGYAWTIELNPDVQWEDGTPINADTYIYTLQQFLNPVMKNYRASTFYEGTVGLANAKAYYSAGGNLYTNADEVVELGATLEDVQGQGIDLYINTGESCSWWGESMDDAYVDYGADYFILEDGTDFFDKYEADTDILVDEDVYADIVYLNCVPGGDAEEDWIQWCFTVEAAPETSWDDVGVIKNNDYSLTFVLTNPTTEFYVEYALQIALVYEDLYESCKVQTGDIVKSSYGTTADSYMSYGPYTITSYQADKEMYLTKNENWHGYSMEAFEGMYQTTDIHVQYISENATILSLFLQGNLDEYGVDTEHMSTYQNSDYIYFEPTTFTYVFTFNTDEEMLKQEDSDGVNHSILSLKDFREAISLSLDRQAFNSQCLAGSDPGYGLINYVYVCDPDTGELYRHSEYAQQSLCELYGVDSEDQITGYDKDAAAELFQQAYEEAVESGLMSATDTIQLDYHVYSDTTNNQNRVNFLQSSISEATKGTDLEGKITINLLVDEEYYDNCQSGLCDIAFTAWGGEDMNPYAMMQCYTDPVYNLVYGYDGYSEMLTFTVEGQEITKSAYDWYVELVEGEYATADLDVRNSILAQMEEQILGYYGMAPLSYLNEANLYSQRIVLQSDTYVNSLVGFGGIAGMTYTMDDAEWAEYCASQNNSLNY
jgi:oligopeptide transport system substrate-binding protein